MLAFNTQAWLEPLETYLWQPRRLAAGQMQSADIPHAELCIKQRLRAKLRPVLLALALPLNHLQEVPPF